MNGLAVVPKGELRKAFGIASRLRAFGPGATIAPRPELHAIEAG